MGDSEKPADMQEAVEHSYRVQWGGRRFCVVAAVVLFVLALLSGGVLVAAHAWFGLTAAGLKIVEIAALVTSLICLIACVLLALEALVRWQREKGQLPDRVIHGALCCSAVTIAGLVFYFFLLLQPWGGDRGIDKDLARVIQFILFFLCGLVWLSAVVLSSAAVAMLVTRRTDLLEVNNTEGGTSLLFRKGHSTEIIKLAVAAAIPFILFIVALLMAGAHLI